MLRIINFKFCYIIFLVLFRFFGYFEYKITIREKTEIFIIILIQFNNIIIDRIYKSINVKKINDYI
jgi:hypothetical protein